MAIWYPGAMTYKEWCQANSFFDDIKNESNRIQKTIRDQSDSISDQTRSIVASQNQMSDAIENSINRLATISAKGFQDVTSSVEALHSDLNYNFGLLIAGLEEQNDILNRILYAIEAPFETKVREFYQKARMLTHQGLLEKAIEYYEKSISFTTGDIFFESHYHLGRVYLYGKIDGENVIDLNKANSNLLYAKKLGEGIARVNSAFKPILADCLFFISHTYFFQISTSQISKDNQLISKTIQACDEAVRLNPNLSQGYFHLAKYYSLTQIMH